MKTKILGWLLISLWVLLEPSTLIAGMGSAHFRLDSSVLSGGGAFMISAHYQKESTLGQPSPSINNSNPPYSKGYALYPGFWYTLGVGDQGSDGVFYIIPNKKGGAAVIYLE